MNKTAIKNFAIWARNKLIADISYRAGLMGITAEGIRKALPQSTRQIQFYDIGTAEPYAVSGEAIRQRDHLVERIRQKEKDTNYQTTYKYVIEEVAYTWFNRLIAVRFMEVNDYLPSHIRVLSSEYGKIEPDLVTTPFDADLDFTREEQQTIFTLKNENKLDELFRLLFIKQCNALNEILPELFERTNDYTELLLNLSVIDQDGVVYHLVHDIPEEDFDVERGGQVEIIGWLYQYYNTEPKNAAFAKKGKITKEEIPAVTQLFTPDWIVRYMVENSLGRLWVEHLLVCGDSRTEAEIAADFGWKYYLPEAEQEPEVAAQLEKIREERRTLTPEKINAIDPCMGSGHICVYLFSVLMQIYESAGYGQREAAKSILENNLYGLDIDDRAFQMAYFAVMMKAREYNRRILNGENRPNLYSIQESNRIDRRQLKFFGRKMNKVERDAALNDMTELLNTFLDAKEYGSILTVKIYNWELLERFVEDAESEEQISIASMDLEETTAALKQMIWQGRCLAQKYEVVVTNPPYMATSNGTVKLNEYLKKCFDDAKADLYAVFINKCMQLSYKNGYVAMITQHTWMFLSTYEKFRNQVLLNDLVEMVHLGSRAFDEIGGEVVQTVSFIRRKTYVNGLKGIYIRLVDGQSEVEKEAAYFIHDNYYYVNANEYQTIPGSPIAYWVSHGIIDAFEKGAPIGKLTVARNGMKTGDNNRFLRLWWEVSVLKVNYSAHNAEEAITSKCKWFPYNKGGEARKWYGNNEYVVNWENEGEEIFKHAKADKRNVQDYPLSMKFKPSGTWSLINTGVPTFRYKECNLSDIAGMSFYNGGERTKYYLGFCNTHIAAAMLQLLAPTINYQAGDIARLPIIWGDIEKVSRVVDDNIALAKKEWDSYETSYGFERHPFLDSDTILLERAYQIWSDCCEESFARLLSNENNLNQYFEEIYNLEGAYSRVSEDEITFRKAILSRDIKSFLSYAVGCMFGRYSLSSAGLVYAGGEWDNHKYDRFRPDVDNIIPISDEVYLEDDIVTRLCEFLKVAFGEQTLEKNLDFIAQVLNTKGSTSKEIIRNYFLNDFYKDHCQTYSVTGSGKRPIYWLFDSGKQNGFKALIYLHRYNADTIGNLRVDYLHRMQRVYESEINRMQDMIDHSLNNREIAQATKRKEKLTKQLKECREYDEKLAHLALSRIELDLDDGVKVNYRKIQTANDGKFYEVLADSKNIMAKKK